MVHWLLNCCPLLRVGEALAEDEVVVLMVEDELEWLLEVVDELLDELLDLLVEVEVLEWLELDGEEVLDVTVTVCVVIEGQLHVVASSGLGKAATARKRVAKVRMDFESMFAD